MVVSGVRSSWLTSATSRCCVSKEPSSRPSMSLIVAVSWPTSSVRHADGDALAQVTRAGDLLRGLGDVLDRPQRGARQDAAAHRRENQRQHAAEQQRPADHDQRVVDVGHQAAATSTTPTIWFADGDGQAGDVQAARCRQARS